MRPAGTSWASLIWALCLLPTPWAWADQASQLSALHRDGQTFITWTCPPGTGWTYRVYASSQRIQSAADLSAATMLGAVGDSTWYDRRLSRITGSVHAYAIDSLAPPLNASQGLFVATSRGSGTTYYAVTAAMAGVENRALIPGENTTSVPVTEQLHLPRPVFQRVVVRNGLPIEIYTLWVSNRDTPLFPAMANRPGMAFDCGIIRGGTGARHSLLIRPHPHGQNFLFSVSGSGTPGEWRLTLDDPLQNRDEHTWWYGYHEAYDVTADDNLPPSSGLVHDYTLRRMEYTLEWAMRTFPIDPARVYASGTSMGGVGSLWLALKRPDLIAAVYALVPKFDFSYPLDPDHRNFWNPGGTFRRRTDRMWGGLSENLSTQESMPIYDRLNMKTLVAQLEAVGMPPIITFNGKNDYVVGWAEKIDFYRAMNSHRQGGFLFWDMRTHTTPGVWNPMESVRELYRFRNDQSYPAFSDCSANFNPGNGNAADGDSVGAVNGFVHWDSPPVESPLTWEITLRLRDLTTSYGTILAPESLLVHVTPRRLQTFVVDPNASYRYEVMGLDNGAVDQAGTLTVDALGLLTVPAVKVERWGSRLKIERLGPLGVTVIDPIDRPQIIVARNPLRGPSRAIVEWRESGRAELELFDTSGRLVASIFRGWALPGRASFQIETKGLPSGVYFLAARQGSRTHARKIVLVP